MQGVKDLSTLLIRVFFFFFNKIGFLFKNSESNPFVLSLSFALLMGELVVGKHIL